MNASPRKFESTKRLTSVDSSFKIDNMIRLADIEKSLRQQLQADEKHLQLNCAERNKLRPHVLRFNDLENEAKTREQRIQRTMALLGAEEFTNFSDLITSGTNVSNRIGFDIDGQLPLWMAIRAIVEQVSEIQVSDLHLALDYFKRKTSRQAIESALASHKETFATKVRGRNKFVSLKR